MNLAMRLKILILEWEQRAGTGERTLHALSEAASGSDSDLDALQRARSDAALHTMRDCVAQLEALLREEESANRNPRLRWSLLSATPAPNRLGGPWVESVLVVARDNDTNETVSIHLPTHPDGYLHPLHANAHPFSRWAHAQVSAVDEPKVEPEPAKTSEEPPRRYRVCLANIATGGRPQRGFVDVMAYTAQDAAYQALVGKNSDTQVVLVEPSPPLGKKNEAHHQERLRAARDEAKDFLNRNPGITLYDLSEYVADAARAHGSEGAKTGSCDTSPSWTRFRVLLAELARRGDWAMRRLSEKAPNLMAPLLAANDRVLAARLERKAKGYAPTNIFEAVRKIDPTARVHVTHDAFEINCAPEKVDEVTHFLRESFEQDAAHLASRMKIPLSVDPSLSTEWKKPKE